MFQGLFFDFIRMFRVCWFCGRYGGGKTLLAVATADWLLRHDYCSRIACNIPLALPGLHLENESEPADVRRMQDVAVVYDEAWLEMQAGSDRKVLSDWLAFVRHRNQFLLFPSVLTIKRQMSFLKVQRILNLLPLGINLWAYSIHLSAGELKETGRFTFAPKRYFGTYDSEPLRVGKETFYIYGRSQAVE